MDSAAHKPGIKDTPDGTLLGPAFFDRDAQAVACDLIGKVLCHHVNGLVLWAAIVETEAYYRAEKASHASLGYTEKRRGLFMPPGTIYMYYARGGDSFNVSCAGAGNAVLIKAGWVPQNDEQPGLTQHAAALRDMLTEMQRRVPLPSGRQRPLTRLCSGQTLLCKALGLRVPDWDATPIGAGAVQLLDTGYRPHTLVRTTRLGIPEGRDEHLPYRFVDRERVGQATQNPLGRKRQEGRDYTLLSALPTPETRDWAAILRR